MEPPENYINQIAEYIIKNLDKGYPVEALKVSLLNQGYSRISVENAIQTANKHLASKIPPIKEKPQITYKLVNHDNSSLEISTNSKKGFFKRLFGK